MKKQNNIISPFIMLLVPLFLLLGILTTNINNEMPAHKERASVKLQMPTLINVIQAVLK